MIQGLEKAGIRTVGQLRELAYCAACEHAGVDAGNLRFHAQWIDEPERALRLVASSKKAA